MTARRRVLDVGVTSWETAIVKNVAGVPAVGLNACKEKRPEENERGDWMWGGGGLVGKGATSGGAYKEPGVRWLLL
jgi:hypothetical protein